MVRRINAGLYLIFERLVGTFATIENERIARDVIRNKEGETLNVIKVHMCKEDVCLYRQTLEQVVA